MEYRENIEDFLDVMSGKKFVKNAIYDKAQKTLFINFYNSYEEYAQHEDKRILTEEEYITHLGSFSTIEKLVILESARILRDYSEIDTVSMSIYLDKRHFDSNMTREELNKAIGYDIRELSPLDNSWTSRFSDIYGYGKKNEKRSELFNHFVTISNNK